MTSHAHSSLRAHIDLEYLYDYYWAMYGQAELKRSEGKAKEDKQASVCIVAIL